MAYIFANTQVYEHPLKTGMHFRLFLIIGICLSNIYPVFAQKIPAKAEKQYRTAMGHIGDRKYEEATKLLEKVVRRHPQYAHAGITLGDLYIQQKNQEKAKRVYEQVIAKNPDFSYRPYFQLGKMCMQEPDYALGKFYFQQTLKFKNIPGSTLQDAGLFLNQCSFALEALSNPVPFMALNMGDSINSEFDEYLPALTADDQTIIYTRKLPKGEDFFISYRLADGSWSSAQAMPAPLNSHLNEGAHCLTADGKTIYFTACYRNDSYGGCDIYMSSLTDNGWSRPINLGENINSPHWETQPSISFDGQHLYFVSNRPGGFGGSDIWMSSRQKNGEWGKPENMGPYINSRKDEMSPFIHHDDQTLYFASEGMAGMGGMDIYLSKRMADGEFGPARNLGYPINTEKNESSLFVNMAGNLALFSAEGADTRGKLDIYYFEMPEEIRPERAIYVKGKIFDANSKRSLDSRIQIIDLLSGELVFETTTFKYDGAFLTSLPAGRSFAFNASREGYLFYSENFSLNDKTASSTHINIPLQPIEAGSEVILKNIFYELNAFALTESSVVELRKLQEFLKLNPGLSIEIQGHTDNVGSKAFNLELSTQRARTVYEALIRFGVSADQLRFKGYGDSLPIADNSTEAGRSTNRRTQFKVLAIK